MQIEAFHTTDTTNTPEDLKRDTQLCCKHNIKKT